jgi:hypothetical protein
MTTGRLAPIIYFAYNRPGHMLQTLEALSKNRLANESDLWIYIDGPKENTSNEDLAKNAEVKKIAQQKQWCKNVTVVAAEKNKGLFKSITEGITTIVNQYGKIIVVEDDTLVSPGFLEYMNDALTMYEDAPEVMHVAGYSLPQFSGLDIKESTYFFQHTTCWGWGTWKRAWSFFDADGKRLMKRIKEEKKNIYRLNMYGGFEFYWGLKAIAEGKFHDWNYNWHTSVFLQNGLCLHPANSLVSNIGHDGSGTNCTVSDDFNTGKPLADKVTVTKIPLAENKIVRDFHKTLGTRKNKIVLFVKHYLRYLRVG